MASTDVLYEYLQQTGIANNPSEADKAKNVKVANRFMKSMGASTFFANYDDLYVHGNNLHTLASAIEMTSMVQPPHKNYGEYIICNMNTVQHGVQYIYAHWFTILSEDYVAIIGYPIVRYIMSNPGNTMVFTHDTLLWNLLRALGLFNVESASSEMAIYPMETFIFMHNVHTMVIVRMCLILNNEGHMPGTFKSSIFLKESMKCFTQRIINLCSHVQHILGDSSNLLCAELPLIETLNII